MCYAVRMAKNEKHTVHWTFWNGKGGKKTFSSGVGRAKVEAFRRKKAAEASVADCWIAWASAPKRKGV